NTRNTIEIKPFTQGLDPSRTTPNGPSSVVVSRPIPEKSTMIPMQNKAAWNTTARLFRKYDMVMGIIGKTQGVKMANNPPPNARSIKGPISCVSGLGGAAVDEGEPGLNSRNPEGMEIIGAGALASIFSGAVAVNFLGGRQRVASQTLKRSR